MVSSTAPCSHQSHPTTPPHKECPGENEGTSPRHSSRNKTIPRQNFPTLKKARLDIQSSQAKKKQQIYVRKQRAPRNKNTYEPNLSTVRENANQQKSPRPSPRQADVNENDYSSATTVRVIPPPLPSCIGPYTPAPFLPPVDPHSIHSTGHLRPRGPMSQWSAVRARPAKS